MAPRTRAKTGRKSSRHPKQVKQNAGLLSTGELDTTPTSRPFQSPLKDVRSEQAHSIHQPNSHGAPQPPKAQPPEDFDDGLDDMDLINLDSLPQDMVPDSHERSFAWSEAGSATRRSSPVRDEETPQDIWQFGDEESLRTFSSAKSGKSKLPDTVPIPAGSNEESQDVQQQAENQRRVDFSETASTVHRSSPCGVDLEETLKHIWEFQDSSSMPALSTVIPSESNLEETVPFPAHSPAAHLPADEIYDATPPTSLQKHSMSKKDQSDISAPPRPVLGDPTPPLTTRRSDAIDLTVPTAGIPVQNDVYAVFKEFKDMKHAKLSMVSNGISEKMEHPQENPVQYACLSPMAEASKSSIAPQNIDTSAEAVASPTGGKLNKRKQRPKATLSFDEVTQKIKDAPVQQKQSAPIRMPIVNAMRASAQPSSSPVVVSRKRQPKAQIQRLPKKRKAATDKNIEREIHPVRSEKAERPSTPLPHVRSSTTRQKQAEQVEKPKLTSTERTGSTKMDASLHTVLISSSDEDSVFSPVGMTVSTPQEMSVSRTMPLPGQVGQTRSKVPGACNGKKEVNQPIAVTEDATPLDELSTKTRHQQNDDSRHERVPLSTRDTNMHSERFPSAEVKPLQHARQIGKPLESKVALAKSSKQQRPDGRQTSRNYSISQQGSPVPLHEDNKGLKLLESGDVDDDTGTSDIELPGIRQRKSKYIRGIDSTLSCNSSAVGPQRKMLEARGDKYRDVLPQQDDRRLSSASGVDESETLRPTLRPQREVSFLSRAERSLHDQLLASLQVQNDTNACGDRNSDETQSSHEEECQPKASPKKTYSGIAGHLHEIVDVSCPVV